MATAPVKSQPLHNFSFSFLKWGTHNSNTDRGGCSTELESYQDPLRPTRVGSRSSRVQRLSFNSKSEKHRRSVEVETVEEMISKELTPKSPRHAAVVGEKGNNDTEAEEEEEEEELVKRPWNLRPRKAASESSPLMEKESESAAMAPPPKSMRLRGLVENGGAGGDRKEKRKFWIALSREEIEEDVYAMTGSRPARRPRRRPKSVQKQLDSVFPGLWLVGASADVFRTTDSPDKR